MLAIATCVAALPVAQSSAQTVRRLSEVNEIAPSRTSEHAAAFDVAREMMVVFGSDGSADGTWGWAGERWMRLAPIEQSPPHRRSAAMVYDAARQVVILHGGTNTQGVVLSDTWEWNGTSWSQVNGAGPARSDHTMVYDSARQRTVLFGGESSGGTNIDRLSAHLWEFDGATWTLVSAPVPSASTPAPRFKHAAAYDSNRGVTVVFGGSNAAALDDTWEWNGSAWSQRVFPSRKPPASDAVAMAFDPDRGAPLLCVQNRTWILCSDGWRLLATGAQKNATGQAMIFDATRRDIIVSGEIAAWPFHHLATLGGFKVAGMDSISGSVADLFRDTSFSGDPDLYLAGPSQASGYNVNGVARWDGARFHPLYAGLVLSKSIARMRLPGGTQQLVFAGHFTRSDLTTVNRVARWNGSFFEGFAGGLNNNVSDLALLPNANGSDDLVVVGTFTADGLFDIPMLRAARWNGSQWGQIGEGLPTGVTDVAVVTDANGQSTIFAAGTFTTGLNAQPLSRIAQFNGTQWTQVGQGLSGTVLDLDVIRNAQGQQQLVAAGNFTVVGSPTIVGLATWNGQSWAPLGDGPGSNVDAVSVIRAPGQPDVLLAASVPATNTRRIMKWDGAEWTVIVDLSALVVNDLEIVPVCGVGEEIVVAGNMSTESGSSSIVRITNTAWIDRYPYLWPEARLARNFAYDPDRGVLVLVSGVGAGQTVFSDTWEFNGDYWTKRDITSPTGVYRSSMAYDPVRQKMVIHGGFDGTNVLSTTWEYDGQQWTARNFTGPGSSPGPRQRHAMAYDSDRGVMVLFGGNDAANAPLGDTWTYDGIAWTRASTSGPSARRYPALAFDPIAGHMVLYGGDGPGGAFGTCHEDTWTWNGSAWTLALADGPHWRQLTAMAWDPVRERLVQFGGYCSDTRYNGVYEWNGQAWLSANTGLARAGAALVFYPPLNAMVTFGGSSGSTSVDVFESNFTAFSAPCISVEPLPDITTACVGDEVQFHAQAQGQPPFTYRWRYSRTNVAPTDIVVGTNPRYGTVSQIAGPTLVLRDLPATADATWIFCEVTSQACTVSTRSTTLDVFATGSAQCPTCSPCPADFDQNGGVEPGDMAAFFNAYESGEPCADIDADGGVTASDIAAFFTVFESGGC